MRAGRLTVILLAGLAIASAVRLPAQASPPPIDLDLAADPQRAGPPAWTWARELLTQSHPGVAARGALHVSVRAGQLNVAAGAGLAADEYLRADVDLDGARLSIRGDATGREVWLAPATAAQAPALLRMLGWLDLTATRHSPAWLDVGALVGRLGTGLQTETPQGLLLTIGAAECGELIVRAQRGGGDVELTARSGGGLLLPAALLWLAHADGAATATEEERWTRLAFAARDSRRDEATLQLARFHSADSERCLRALLHLDDGTELRAIEALARRGAVASLPLLAAHAQAADPYARAVAQAAIAALWPRAQASLREDLRARVGADRELTRLLDGLDRPLVANVGGASETPAEPAPLTPTRRAIAAALLFTAGLLTIWVARHWRRSAPPSPEPGGAQPRGQRIS